jgi:hypothetical protein
METEFDWQQYKLEQRKLKAERLGPRTKEIMALKELGYEVKQLTPYQFRISNQVDVYPVNNRYCKLCYNRWGSYRNVKELITKLVKL